MKRNVKIFLRTLRLSIIWAVFFLIIILGIGKSYEKIREIRYGEIKNAVSYDNGVLYILDFKLFGE